MSTEAALLRTIRDMPDEDTPRLVYADYLEEEGNAPRAEFIRVQVELARLPEGDPRRNELEDREHELLAEHECSWIGVSADDMDELESWRFDRGFIHEVAASPAWMRTTGADLCAANPLRRWRVTSGRDNFPDDLKEAAQRGWASRLESLDLSNFYPGLGELSGALGTKSNYERLRELNLIGRGPLQSLPDIIDFAPFRDQLTSLRFGQTGWDGGGLDVPEFVRALGTACKLQALGVPGTMLMTDDANDLLRAAIFASLTSLDISNNQIDTEAVEPFRTAKFRLRELDLSGTQLGGTALPQLLGFASFGELRVLRLNRCGNTTDNIRALAASRFWAQAEELRMQLGMQWVDDGLEYEGAAPPEQEPVSLTPLFTSPGSKTLRSLDLTGNNLRDAGVAALCGAAWAESLTYLDLSQNYLSDAALTEIARCARFENLRTLHLNFNSAYHLPGAAGGDTITDAGLRALADSPRLANLRVLSLSGTRITAAGIEAVLNSPHWRLSELRISQCQLRPNAISAIVESPRLSRLAVLDISSNDEIDMSDLEPLAESEYLSPMTELHVRGLYAEDTTVRDALRERLGRRLRG